MRLDKEGANILSELFLDIAKAFFIAALVTPPLTNITSIELVFLLTKELLNGMLFMLAAWYFAKQKERL